MWLIVVWLRELNGLSLGVDVLCQLAPHQCPQASACVLCCAGMMQDLRRTRSVMVTVNNLMDVW